MIADFTITKTMSCGFHYFKKPQGSPSLLAVGVLSRFQVAGLIIIQNMEKFITLH
jgi:hypothetical protein